MKMRVVSYSGLCAALCCLMLVGCSSTDEGSQPATQDDGTPTYYRDVQPLVQKHCASCHSEGGAGGFRLDTPESLGMMADASLSAMQRKSMPPWLPDPSCREFHDQRIMTPQEIIAFSDWVKAGKPLGDPASAPAQDTQKVEQTLAFEPDLTASITGGYLPKSDDADDYHCFILDDLEFAEDTYLTGSQVVPGSPLVHHVLVYSIGPDQLEQVRALDAAEEGPGYTCFGGPTEGNTDRLPNQIAAWVPGSKPSMLGEGVANRIEAGSRIVVQMHYSLLGGMPVPDHTELALTTAKETPKFLSVVRPLPILRLDIPAGDAEVKQTRDFHYYGEEPITIRSVSPHMHLLGSKFSADLVKPNADRQCMLDIPRWDFGWQQSYSTKTGDDHITVEDGDRVRVRCFYDNSPANQPVVDGAQLTPRDVKWGDGTLDEMCILYIEMLKPYRPRPAAGAQACAASSACVDACPEGEGRFDCLMKCPQTDFGCGMCALQTGGQCGGIQKCGGEYLAVKDCVRDCMEDVLFFDGNPGRCFAGRCEADYKKFTACVEPHMADPACATPMKETCGVGM